MRIQTILIRNEIEKFNRLLPFDKSMFKFAALSPIYNNKFSEDEQNEAYFF